MQAVNRSAESKNWMVEAVVELLLPAVEKMGFEHVSPRDSKNYNREYLLAFPVGTFRRRTPDGVDMVEPHFFGRDKFSIDTARIPLEGINTRAGQIPAEDCMIAWGSSWFELYQHPLLKLPFAVRWNWGRPPARADYEKVVGEAVGYLPEIEVALSNGTAGPHVRYVEIKR